MKNFLATIGGIVAFLALFAIPLLVLGGAIKLFERFGENLTRFCSWLFIITLVLLLLTPIRPLRRPIGNIINVFTYVWGATTWLFSAYVCYVFWGIFGVLIGLMILGVGVAPVALVALASHGHFADAGWLLLSIFFVFAFRFLSMWLMGSRTRQERNYFIATGG